MAYAYAFGVLLPDNTYVVRLRLPTLSELPAKPPSLMPPVSVSHSPSDVAGTFSNTLEPVRYTKIVCDQTNNPFGLDA